MYGYGIGTTQNWDECVAWMRKAASLGNSAALILSQQFVSTTMPHSVTRAEPSDDETFERLKNICLQYRRSRNFVEFFRVVEMLQDMDPERYREQHADFTICYCTSSGNALPQGGNDVRERFVNILRLIFNYLRSGDQLLPPDLSGALNEVIKMHDVEGRTLLHYIAICTHPPAEDQDINIVRLVGAILIEEGCPINKTDIIYQTALDFSIVSRNFSIMRLLLEHAAVSGVPLRRLEQVVRAHDHKVLEMLMLNSTFRDALEDITFDVRGRKLNMFAINVPNPERRLTHGRHYEIRGQETVKLLLNHAYGENQIPSDDSYFLLSAAVISGNSDFFVALLDRSPPVNDIPTPSLPLMAPLLHQTIACQQKEIFLILLERGADINAGARIFFNSPPIHVTRFQAHDRFFFEELLSRGADLTISDTHGNNIVNKLVWIEDGAASITSVLKKEPKLLDHSLYYSEIPILHHAAAVAKIPANVAALLHGGVDVTILNKSGITVLEAAAFIEDPQTLECLKVILAYEDAKNLPGKMNRRGMALIRACRGGNISAIELLVELRTDPNFIGLSGEEHSPLFWAMARRMMFTNNSDARFTAGAPFEKTKFKQVRQLLLQYGADEGLRYGTRNTTAEGYCSHILKR